MPDTHCAGVCAARLPVRLPPCACVQVAITLVHLQYRQYLDTIGFCLLVAAQVILLYFRLQYFTRVFHPGGARSGVK